jgi:TonB family protein
MTRDARFWRNVTIVGLVHLGLLFGLLWWSRNPSRVPKDVVWMEGGAGTSAPAEAETPPPMTPEALPVETPEEMKEEPTPEVAPTAKSEIEIPSPAASTTPTPTPTAKPTPKPTPRPTPKPTPKRKPTPSPTPKKATPKSKPTPDEKDEKAAKEVEKKKAIAKALLAKEKSDEETAEKSVQKATAADDGESKAKGSSGSGGKGSGAGGASDVGWYGNMLHDRFYSEWVQPTSVVHSARLSVLLRIRIQKDGRISEYSIAKSSGNPVVDDSVKAAAARVKQVDPLPSGVGDDYYDVNINFELN